MNWKHLLTTACALILCSATDVPLRADVLTNLTARYAFDSAPDDDKVLNDVANKYVGVNKTYPKGAGALWHDQQGGIMEFSGNDYILLPKTIADQETFSVAAWFNAAPQRGTETKIVAGNGGYALSLAQVGKEGRKLRWAQVREDHQGRSWSTPLWSDNPIGPDEWHHVVVTYDSKQIVMYVNGVQQQSVVEFPGKLGPKMQEAIATWVVGNGDQWEGCLDDIRFYDIALTPEQVREVFQSRPKTSNIRPASTRPEEPAAPPVPVTWLKPSGEVDYLKLVQAYADTLIERGRDTFGKEHSPLFAAALNRRTYKFSQFRGVPGIRPGDRTLSGANPMQDQNLYQILYALAKITGQEQYSREADATLKYFFEHCQSPETGLLTWGEHMGWDMEDEVASGNGIHEYARPWVLWDQSFQVAPAACGKFAAGLWDHQISDDKTTFSRHAAWAKHGPGKENEFPRHGGFYIATWASAYKWTKDSTYLTAIQELIKIFDANKSTGTNAIASSTSTGNNMNKVMWPSSNLSLAIDLMNAATVVPAGLRADVLAMADEIDKTYLKLGHDMGNPQTGFVTTADVDTLKPITANGGHNNPYTRTWVMGYGSETDAYVANLCYERYKQLSDQPAKDAYRKLILASASRYLTEEPEMQKATVFPGAMGNAIWHMLCAYRLSGDQRFLDRADHFSQLAVQAFITDGCPLPRASSVNDHYEAITGADTIMMSLLWLSEVKSGSSATANLVYTDR